MSLPVRLLPTAQQEFDDAADWYERQKAGLGADFVAAVRATIQGIAATPTMHAVVYKDVRKGRVRRFPYIILYREDGGELLVVSVFHTSRDPSAWQGRV